jgi:ferrochelatase
VLATRRAPGLVAEYRAIGGSPLIEQSVRQAELLAAALDRRGHSATVRVGMQFTDPGIPQAVEAFRAEGVGRLIALPVYPITGPSTTIAALEDLEGALRAAGWPVPVREVLGWHGHTAYTRLRAEGVRAFCQEAGLDLDGPGTRLVMCAHGTPVTYLREGSRYAAYVDDHCRRLAEALGDVAFVRGYQNHANRPGVEWTQPSIEDVVAGLEAERVVMVPVSYMQEQSETLAGMDHELREEVEARGMEYHRVPVPHDDPAFAELLADLVEPLLGDDDEARSLRCGPCACRDRAGAVCGVRAAETTPPARVRT